MGAGESGEKVARGLTNGGGVAGDIVVVVVVEFPPSCDALVVE